MSNKQFKLSIAVLLFLIFSPHAALGGEPAKKKPCCGGLTYSVAICSGDTICPLDNGNYDFPYTKCDNNPIKVTPKNIDDFIGNINLSDPPCANTKNCKRISIVDSSGIPAKNTACRFREKIAVCESK
ncbi:MAG: hypothetical protein A6F71_06800 [Cycloclasticus sp. symbiont of Poecilosclerida sp. M]|nr:MAG: hypothetical protein A6F71_06800 [Cycloclasticus sp. symbiont of Poecilosclerida sp. M]